MGGRWAVATSKSWNEKKWSCESQIFPNLVLYVNCQLSTEHSREANSNCRACENHRFWNFWYSEHLSYYMCKIYIIGCKLSILEDSRKVNKPPSGWQVARAKYNFRLRCLFSGGGVVGVACGATLSYQIYSPITIHTTVRRFCFLCKCIFLLSACTSVI